MTSIRVLMVGGGSAGHVAPMVAVAEALETIDPDVTVSFVVSDTPSDGAFLTMEKRAFRTLPLPRRSLALPFVFLRAFLRSGRILRTERPHVVFSKGGAVSVPMVLAARMRRLPVVAHESDAITGWANSMATWLGATVLLATHVGNPIRARITQGTKNEGLRITGFSGKKPILLVMGGSQGARAINEVVTRHLDDILALADVIHLTGVGKKTLTNRPGYYATEFGSDILPHLYACADLAVSRAGAGSIAELAACGVPSIFVPIQKLAGDHQVKNVESLERDGAAIVLPQDRLDAELVSRIRSILENVETARSIADKMRNIAHPEAARLVAETVVQSVARQGDDA